MAEALDGVLDGEIITVFGCLVDDEGGDNWRAGTVEARLANQILRPIMRVQSSRANWKTQARPTPPY